MNENWNNLLRLLRHLRYNGYIPASYTPEVDALIQAADKNEIRTDRELKLEGYLKQVETIRYCGQGDNPENICPFCRARREYPSSHGAHRLDCDVFNPDGSLK